MHTQNLQLRILIIDDEKELRLTIKEVFEIYGWVVDDAENGQKGLELMSANAYDFVISDIRMPVSTGVDFLQKLPASVKAKTPIIMMSAYSDYSEQQLQELGAQNLISKPISIRDLVKEMEQFKNRKQAA